MTLATASALRRLMERLVPSPRPVPVPLPIRRALALGLLALAPDALAQRGGTVGTTPDRGPRRDTVATAAAPRTGRVVPAPVRVAPARDAPTRPAPPRGGYDTERRIEEQRRAAEERQHEAQRRATGQTGYSAPAYGAPAYGGYDSGRYGSTGYGYGYDDRYWGSAWSPVLRFRQRVRVESDRRYGSTALLDLRTHYRQRRVGSGRSGERLELQIERLDVYQDGRYLGSVDQYDLPHGFRQAWATRQRDGALRLENDLLLVGEARVGFELIRFDGDDFYGSWRRQYDALQLDLRRSSARRVGYSRLFDPYDYRGYAPVSIVPDVEDDFYGGYGYGYGSPGYDGARAGMEGPVYGQTPRTRTNGSGDVRPSPSARPQSGAAREGAVRESTVRAPRSRTVTLPGGQRVQVERETEIAPSEGGQ